MTTRPATAPTIDDLRGRLDEATIADAHRLRGRLRGLRRRTGGARERALEEVAADLERSAAEVAAKRASAVVPTYPDELPITARREEILAMLRDHQVVVVAGETGSGKSTQLPKLCLELGRGVRGLVGHTQPRRIAARAVAERVADELGVEVGGQVGYAVRFADQVGPDTRLKVMTDGILLNELQRDRLLLAYDTIIVDEAHERSLNIDFILGYLKQLLPQRPDLKVVVTSATIDTARFAEHFADADGNPAPIVEASGRTYPVEVRWRPDPETGEPPDDTVQAVVDAVRELVREGPGDVLVFASGEREIRDMADAVEGAKLPGTEVLPLFARLSAAEQHRVFASHRGRRIVIATNIAETSITVPGIRYVVDPGTARISRYSKRTKVQRLPIEAISQASADQRAGRCGRVAPGICIRLYSEQDYDARPEFTEPEILRTNLASVVLQMTAIGLGDVESFPFVEPPDRRNVADGVALLEELGALEPDRPASARRLTPVGRRLARLPLDPTLGRMVLEAERFGCVHEVMVIAAGLSIQDPRERPLGREEEAAQHHARFRVPGSDFLGYVALWHHVGERQRELSSSKFRREAKAEHLHVVRLREWQDVYTQIRQVVRGLGIRIDREPASADAVHRALLAGLIGTIGARDDETVPTPGRGRDRPRGPVEFVGPRGARFSLARGSVLAKKPPRWIVAAEVVETNRLWARTAATIQPAWIEQAAAHVIVRTYDEARWNRDRGAAEVIERVRFRALAIVDGRTVNLDRVDRRLARELFIRHALVRGEWDTHHAFAARNAERIAEVRAMEDRARRRDILVDEDAVHDLFDARIPDDVTDVRRFDRWWRDAQQRDPHLLDLTVDDLVAPVTVDLDEDAFPEVVDAGPAEVRVDYEFAPGRAHDGVTFEIPVAVLNRTDPAPFEWLVPGLRTELVTTLIKALPKAVRRNLVPAPDRAAEVVARIGPDDGPLRPVLAAELSRLAGDPVSPDVWEGVVLPAHLRPRFRVVEEGRTLAEGDDLAALERQLRAHLRATVVAQAPDLERDGLTAWTIGSLPRVVETVLDGLPVHGYPAIVDQQDAVGVRILASREQQRALHWNGVRRLLALQLPKPTRALQRRLDPRVLLGLTAAPHGTVTAAVDDALHGVIDALLLGSGGPPFDEQGFDALLRRVKDCWLDDLAAVVTTLADVVQHADRLRERLTQPAPGSWSASLDDLTDQLAALVFAGMVVSHGADRLAHLPRYLDAMDVRLDKLRESPAKDLDKLRVIRALQAEHAAAVAEHGLTAALDEVRWLIEELRVQLFAQQLGTPVPVSEKRIRERLRRLA